MRIGLDIGSTTLKAVVLDEADQIVFSDYQRHYSQIVDKTLELIAKIHGEFPELSHAQVAISGSAGMGLADTCAIPFVQEVYATRICADRRMPGTDAIIELGGEDAKILFLGEMPDARMNGSCAGGTGAFIDQMATLLNVSLEQLNELAKQYEKTYTIASRCGVFAKSDIQPLLNQGARESDLAVSIFDAVVNQTIAGLSQGRPIQGQVLYLGGPLSFMDQLRARFDRTLKLTGICPEHSLYYVALGAAYCAGEDIPLADLAQKLEKGRDAHAFAFMDPLFADEAEYQAFLDRHSRAQVPTGDLAEHQGPVFLGVDAGSTTIKFAVIDAQGRLLDSQYRSNSGNPVPQVRAYLQGLYQRHPGIRFGRAAVTGYGEDLIKSAFLMDHGIVETVAHTTAARALDPQVEFILDIGGQDMKCMKIKDGVVDNIYLNEACSSGCGSFLQTFAIALGYSIEDFAKLGLFADRPVDLGSRCTVFMNSSVKQAQKDGASTQNISAGLSISVVKNALYKVIRPSSKEELGKHIVVQGGTFYNDAVLRAFEKEMDVQVTRPDIAGLMGAYGAALYALERYRRTGRESTLMNARALEDFSHEVKVTNCGLCPNNCRLTINLFEGGRRYISGNRCERPVTKIAPDTHLNLYRRKLDMLLAYRGLPGPRGKIGLPFGLNMYELLPFWHAFFTKLGFEVVLSPVSDRKLYLRGQATIPSDTVCFPAKLMHGHVQTLIEQGINTIFYPCMSYNLDEGLGDNCYNCPVVAYYPEVIQANMLDLQGIRFIAGYVGLHRRKDVGGKLLDVLRPYFPDLTLAEIETGLEAGYTEYYDYMDRVRRAGKEIVTQARAENLPIIVLAGRPYHVDPEINHGMDQLISGFGVAVVSEEAVADPTETQVPPLQVLNQWTYHSRLYAAAQYVAGQPDMQLVQLVSFGCGCDAITTDECRRLLEEAGRIYTQIKIDEIENLGAARIRIRSLLAATQSDPEEKARSKAAAQG